MIEIRLRFWALAQYVYGFLRDVEGAVPVLYQDRVEDAKARWRLFKRSVLQGHADLDLFACLDQHDPQLRDPRVAAGMLAVKIAAFKRLIEYRALGPEKTGYLGGYVTLVAEHFAQCAKCQSGVRAQAQLDAKTSSFIREAYSYFSDEERQQLLLQLLPAKILAKVCNRTN